MDFQPVINIGLIGHVSDGKSTLTKCITGIQTQKFSQEKQTNITIRLGYANAKIYKCEVCPEPQCYYSNNQICKNCNTVGVLKNHISFVDCPGHNSFMGNMLNGTSVMDYTITVESVANKVIPAPQTVQHLNAVELNNIPNIAIVLNKIDLVNENTTNEKITELQTFIQKYKCANVSIIPMSASFDINVDVVCQLLANLPVPVRNIHQEDFKMAIIRSFNINLPGTQIDELKGGVIGGSIMQGSVTTGDTVYIYPGIVKDNTYTPITATVQSIYSEKTLLTTATCGGLIGIGLDIDPGLTGDDALVGNVICKENKGIVTKNIKLELTLFENYSLDSSKQYILNINTCNVEVKIENNRFLLKKAVYINEEDTITIILKTFEGLTVIGQGKMIDYECLNLSK